MNSIAHVPFKHKRTSLERIEKFISENYFTDVNIFNRKYKSSIVPSSILHYGPTDRISYLDAMKNEETFLPANVGNSFGPTFSTHWFKILFKIPSDWDGEKIDLIWDSGCEAMLWLNDNPEFSFSSLADHGCKKTYTLTENLCKDDKQVIEFVVEMACNRELGEGDNGMIKPPNMNKQFTLNQVELVCVSRWAYKCYLDLQVLYEIAKSLPEDGHRGMQALYAANDIINQLVTSNFSQLSYEKAHDIAQQYFKQTNNANQHAVHAIGHCHIDTAWLWPYAETKRKCARSWISTIHLMKKYPHFKFACSQAQQYQWVKEKYPKIYAEIKVYVNKGQFIPVGGTWVEMDGNLPSGESMIRQFYYGQRFFNDEFGIFCKEFWLPDTFGYSGNLPQIMEQAGIRNFLTQKLSWNLVNKFPHHSFHWKGINGTRILTHFPPGGSYGMEMTPHELIKTMTNNSEKGRVDRSMFLFGHGDGGGGPTEVMLKRYSRMKDCAGLPKMEMSTPDEFFSEVRISGKNLCTWVGELFLELHNGTYTSLAKIKEYNRRCEVLLHDVELLCTIAHLSNKCKEINSDNSSSYCYPKNEIERLWKSVLLNQFHDVLPGSSIEMVNKDAIEIYEQVVRNGNQILISALKKLIGVNLNGKNDFIVNTLPWDREEVITLSDGKQALANIPSMGYAPFDINMERPFAPVSVEQEAEGTIILSNGILECHLDKYGRIIHLILISSRNRDECVVPGQCANQFVIFDDVPLYWDAWDVMDYHLETRLPVESLLEPLKVVKENKFEIECKFVVGVGEKSKLTQFISLQVNSPLIKFRTQVDWHESHKFLKVEFPWNIRSNEASYEIQFGHVKRPTHQNTSWDSARFEVWGHKWADLSQHNLGVSILNNSKYGYSAFGNVMRLSLLRSPKAPDSNADMGFHSFMYAVMPHKGTFQESGVIRQAYQLNYPLHISKCNRILSPFSFVQISDDAIILETFKKSDNHSECIVIRLYEAFGGSGNNVKVSLPHCSIKSVDSCNILEENKEEIHFDNHNFCLDFKPFQFRCILICLL